MHTYIYQCVYVIFLKELFLLLLITEICDSKNSISTDNKSPIFGA